MAKGDKKKKKKEIIELTPEEKFVQLKTLMRATRCLLVEEDVYRIYVRLVKDFAELGELSKETPFEGCEECAALSEECAVQAEKWKKKLPAERREESRTVTTTVREKEQNGTQKKGKGKWIFLGVVVLVVCFIVCYQIPATRYQIAGVAGKLGFDEVALDSYYKLGDYSDSRSQIAKLEQKSIRNVKIGGVVSFGQMDWMVLERLDGKALLSKYMADNKHPFHDKKEEVTWEKCSLRRYLNDEFLMKSFSEEERALIMETRVVNGKNPEYGTDGGADTTDYIFLMNESEYEKYRKKLKDKSKTMRLRTPGKDATSTTYVSALKEIVTYGFPVNENGACIRPTMWVNLE